jgi:hypothetical protein
VGHYLWCLIICRVMHYTFGAIFATKYMKGIVVSTISVIDLGYGRGTLPGGKRMESEESPLSR